MTTITSGAAPRFEGMVVSAVEQAHVGGVTTQSNLNNCPGRLLPEIPVVFPSRRWFLAVRQQGSNLERAVSLPADGSGHVGMVTA
jgi:hypothetical protein